MRIAILGCGSIGKRHARNLVALGRAELVLYDPDPHARAGVEGLPGAVLAGTLEEVWRSEPHVVFVTAPTDLHVPLALEAARRGCDLFVEKPLSSAWDGVEVLCSEVETRGLISMVGCNMRFHPGPARVKELLASGALGRVVAARIHTASYLPDWRPGGDYRKSYSASLSRGGGAILDCIHEIDLALWYFGPGSLLAAVSAPAETLGLEVEGAAEILLKHDSGVLSSVHVNFVQRDYRRGCEVIGSEGTLYWDFLDGRVRWVTPAGEQAFAQPPSWDLNDMYRDELACFLDCIGRRAPAPNGVRESLSALRIALEAREAGRGLVGEAP